MFEREKQLLDAEEMRRKEDEYFKKGIDPKTKEKLNFIDETIYEKVKPLDRKITHEENRSKSHAKPRYLDYLSFNVHKGTNSKKKLKVKNLQNELENDVLIIHQRLDYLKSKNELKMQEIDHLKLKNNTTKLKKIEVENKYINLENNHIEKKTQHQNNKNDHLDVDELKALEVNLKQHNLLMVNRLASFNNEIESKQSLIRFYNVELESLNAKERDIKEKFNKDIADYDVMLSQQLLSNKNQEDKENLLKSKSTFCLQFLDNKLHFDKIKELESILQLNMEKNKYEYKDISELINNVIHKIKTIKGFYVSKNQIKEQMNLLEKDTIQLDYVIKLLNDNSTSKNSNNTYELEKIQKKAVAYLEAQNFILQMTYIDFNNMFGKYSKIIEEIIKKIENSNKFKDKETDTIDSQENLNSINKERIFNIKFEDFIIEDVNLKDKFDYSSNKEISKFNLIKTFQY